MQCWRWTLRSLFGGLVCAVLVAGLATVSCAQEKSSSETGASSHANPPAQSDDATDRTSGPTTRSSSLRLGTGDLVELNVYNVPELTTKTRVSSNGDIYLPLISYVHVSGLSLEEAQAIIEKRYADGGFLKDPHVTLFVDEYASQGASVLGEVTKPGVYPVLGDQRLLDLISAAGGFTDKAGRTVTITHRDQPDKPTTLSLSRDVGQNPENNVAVYPGDTVIVRRADIVYVVGEVARPSGFLMDNGSLTVLQAIALAGGTNHNAKLGAAKIIRKGPQGMTETPVQLKQMLAAKAPDIPLHGDDILFVPTSTGKVVVGRTLEAAVQAATAVSIVAVRP